ncbi:MAG TPA: aminotransferase class I/II-fold pyridoxal phosphate-dependent enzyme, partial [Brevundimonas sp.]
MGAFDFADFFSRDLDDLKQEGRYRVFADLERLSKGAPYAWDHRRERTITIWCSNDYLSMGVHLEVVEAAQGAIRTYGAGAGGTRNISGTSHEHVLLERDLADLHGKEAALLFTSGYAANDAALSTLASRLPGAVIFSDTLNHASMIEGMRRSSVEKRIFAHNDWRDLDRLM